MNGTGEQGLLAATEPAGRNLARGWLALGVGALALAGVFAILLVLARSPGFEALFPNQDFFRTALVVHVDQSVLIWFLAFSGLLWSLGPRPVATAAHRLALYTAAAGCALVAVSPFLGAGDPLMNNYVPVLQHPLFHGGLLLFGAGILLQVLLHLGRGPGTWTDPLVVGVFTAALATLLAMGSLGWTWARLSSAWEGHAWFEYLFWGPGHVLQFAYTQAMLVAWIWLARASGVPVYLGDRGLVALLLLGALPLLAVPLIHAFYAPDSAESRVAFTELMRWGNGLAAVPLGLLLLIGLFRREAPGEVSAPAFRALLASLLLFGAGGLIGSLIAGVNTVIPAHYHGSIVGVTLALMGLTYLLMPALGLGPAEGRLARMQPLVYGFGQLLHIGGLAASGAMGIQRKTAGAAQGLQGWEVKATMGVMGLGGLLAVVGGILFVWVVLRGFLRRRG